MSTTTENGSLRNDQYKFLGATHKTGKKKTSIKSIASFFHSESKKTKRSSYRQPFGEVDICTFRSRVFV